MNATKPRTPRRAALFGALLAACCFSLLPAGCRKRPDAERPYRAFGYPLVPALYIVAASAISLVLLVYRTKTSLPGLIIVLLGVPVYFLLQSLWRRAGERS